LTGNVRSCLGRAAQASLIDEVRMASEMKAAPNDLREAIADDASAVLLTRVGIIVIAVTQPLYVISELRMGEGDPRFLIGFHVFNLIVALAGLSISWSDFFKRHWRSAAFILCASLMISATTISIAVGGRTEALFLSLILIMFGSAMLLPWEPIWQARLSAVSVTALAANTILVHSHTDLFYHWLGILTAAALSQSATTFGVRYRERTAQYQALHEREARLRESEEKFRRIFESNADILVITRMSDGHILDVNPEFLKRTGMALADVAGKRISELEFWPSRDERRAMYQAINDFGTVRDLEANLVVHGQPSSVLISSVTATISGEACVISTLRDVTALRQLNQRLMVAREAALAASEAKSEFLSCMSHEIRTPMNVILGMADMLAETKLGSEQSYYINKVRDNGAMLLDLINSILDLTRIESGQLTLEQMPFDLVELTERVVDAIAIRAHEKGLEIAAHFAPGVPSALMGDPLRLQQVLANLVGNAIKFTERGEVVVTVEPDPEEPGPGNLRFVVVDTGIGIAPEKLTTIFSPFAQADSSTTRRYGGSGLGLAIVDRLVRLMGGTVRVESRPGEGSRFYFSVRFAAEPAPAAVMKGNGAAQDGIPAALSSGALAGVCVLVAGENVSTRGITREMLAGNGARASEAALGEMRSRVEAARDAGEPFNLVVVDCGIAGGDAIDRAAEIKVADPNAKVIVLISSDGLTSHLERLRAAGLEHYLVKPVKRRDLIDLVGKALGGVADKAVEILPEPAALLPEQSIVGRQVRILLADDSPDNRLVIRAYLRRMGCTLDEAENGAEAADKFTHGTYDLVLMDIQMPVMDGYTAVGRIRQWEREQGRGRTPIVALTASAFDETARMAAEAGCDAHLAKPIRRATLIAAIEQFAPHKAEAESAPVSGIDDHDVVAAGPNIINGAEAQNRAGTGPADVNGAANQDDAAANGVNSPAAAPGLAGHNRLDQPREAS